MRVGSPPNRILKIVLSVATCVFVSSCNLLTGDGDKTDPSFHPGVQSLPGGPAPQLTLTSVLPTATDDSAAAFAGGTSTGVAFSSGKLRLGSGGGCDGTAKACAELSPNWTPAWSQIVGYWKMNNDWLDVTTVNNGLPQNAPTFSSSSAFGAAAGSFNGSNQYVDVGSDASLTSSTTVTVAAWVKFSTLNGSLQGVVSKSSDINHVNYVLIIDNSNNMEFAIKNGAGIQIGAVSTSTFATGVWYHFLGTFDGAHVRLYVNGKLENEVTQTFTPPTGGPTWIGSSSNWFGSSYVSGLIDDVAIWSVALNADAVNTIYQHQAASYAGTYTSRVIDAGLSKAWSNLSWLATLPFGKELPDNGMSESSVDYSALVGSDGTTATHDLMSGNLGLWHLDEPIGTTGSNSIKDSSVSKIDGTPTGSPLGVAGRFGSSASFSSSSIDYGNPSLLNNLPNGSYSVSFWLNSGGAQPSTYGTIISKNGPGPWPFFFLVTSSGQLYRWDNFLSTTTIVPNQWYHVLYTYNFSSIGNGTETFYVNGQIAGTRTGSVYSWNSGSDLVFGNDTGNNFPLNGSLDEVAFWSRALSANEAKQLYQRGASRLKFQVKSCAFADCSDGTWQGPDGSNQTYFSELNNNSVPLAMSGSVLTTLPNMLFSAFTSPPSASRYFQYRAIFEAEDSDVTLGPQLQNVKVKTSASRVLPSYTATGTCSVEGATVNVTVTVGGGSASGSGTCTAGTYSVVVDVSSLSNGMLTITASSTVNGATGTASGTYTGGNTALPNNATTLAWAEGASTTNYLINATWTPATPTVKNQLIQFYTGNCAATSGSLINLGSATIATKAFTGSNGNSYSYKITSIDSAGNSQTSGCSAVIAETRVLTDDASNASASTTPSFQQATAVGVNLTANPVVLSTTTNNAELDASWTPEWSHLLGYWKMNGNWKDSKNANDGVAQGSASFTTFPKVGSQAGTFNGTSDYSLLPLVTNHATNVSMGAWFSTSSLAQGNQTVISNGWGGATSTTLLVDGRGAYARMLILYGGITFIDTSYNINDLNWHFAMLTILNDGTPKVYIDGILVFSGPASPPGTPTPNSSIGADPNGSSGLRFFNGKIDDATIWDIALSASEIQSIYNRQSAKYAGQLTSRVMNYGSADPWSSLKWLTTLPFGKELPDGGAANSESSTDYSSQTAGLMSGNVGLWHLNEASASSGGAGNDFKDGSGNSAWGTSNGSVAFNSPGILKGAATFDGSTGYISFGDILAFDTSDPWSISAWIQYTSTGGNIVSKQEDSGNYTGYGLALDGSGKIQPFLYNGAFGGIIVSSNLPYNDGNWHHILVSYSGNGSDTGMKIYVDGSAVSTTAVSGYLPGSIITTADFQFSGRGGADDLFCGTIDEVSVWSRELSDVEALELYRRGANRIKFQVRSCTTSDCSDRSTTGDWLGPDNSNQSYFSELQNNSAYTSVGSVTNNVLAGFPQMVFAYFSGLTVPTRQYFQYRAILESDDTGTACGGSWCSPELKSVTISP